MMNQPTKHYLSARRHERYANRQVSSNSVTLAITSRRQENYDSMLRSTGDLGAPLGSTALYGTTPLDSAVFNIECS